MDNHSRSCDGWRHETSWQSTAVGSAPSKGDCVAALGRDLPEGGPGCEGVGELGGTMESSLPHKRKNGLEHEADPRASAAADVGPDFDSNEAAGRWRQAGGVCQRSLDVAEGGRTT